MARGLRCSGGWPTGFVAFTAWSMRLPTIGTGSPRVAGSRSTTLVTTVVETVAASGVRECRLPTSAAPAWPSIAESWNLM